MYRIVAVAIVSTAVFAGLLSAQFGCPPLPAEPKPKADAEKPPDSVTLLRKALAEQEWIKSPGHALTALKLLTVPVADGAGGLAGPRKAASLALAELIAGDAGHQELFTIALGDPDSNGQPYFQGSPDFLDLLTKASRLDTELPALDEFCLFDSANQLIGKIAGSPGGRERLRKIQDSFDRKDNHVAIFQLLDAFPYDEKDKDYPRKLEVLRTAFAVKTERLAKLVTAMNSPAKS